MLNGAGIGIGLSGSPKGKEKDVDIINVDSDSDTDMGKDPLFLENALSPIKALPMDDGDSEDSFLLVRRRPKVKKNVSREKDGGKKRVFSHVEVPFVPWARLDMERTRRRRMRLEAEDEDAEGAS